MSIIWAVKHKLADIDLFIMDLDINQCQRIGFLQYNYNRGSNYTGAKFSYKYTSMKDLTTVSQVNDVTYDTPNSNITLNYDEDQRYILEYTLVDQNYTSKPANLTNNSNRGKSTGKRVIWASDNVEISNGYEFYAKQNVTMSKEEFDGFSNSNNKAQYYNKIAEAAGARVFKTADYNFTDKIGGDYIKGTVNSAYQ